MKLYHGSPMGGLQHLEPFVSEHKKPYIYFSSNPVAALLYAVHPVEKPFSWYPYGFDSNGIVCYCEYYPDAFADIYKGKTGYLYECNLIENLKKPTNINGVYACTEAVAVDRMTEIKDIYTALLEYQNQGLFRVKLYENITEKEMRMIHEDIKKTITDYELLSKPACDMSMFYQKHFKDVWDQCETIRHYDMLVD